MKRGKWTRGKVREYCRSKGWKVSVVYEMKREALRDGTEAAERCRA